MRTRFSLTLRAASRQWLSLHRPSTSLHARAFANATADATSSVSSISASSSSSPPPPPSPPPLASSPSPSSSSSATTSSDPALHKLVDDISVLTLLQAADLVTLLKTRLNIQEIALPAAGAVAQPASAVAGGADADEVAEEAAKPKEKMIFNVKLESFDASVKPKIIKEVKAIVPNLTLIEAKKFVESVPKVLKEGINKEDAEKIKNAFEAHGAVVILE